MSFGGNRKNSEPYSRGNDSQGAPKYSFLIDDSEAPDTMRPFNLTFIDTTPAASETKYLKNAMEYHGIGRAAPHGLLFHIEPKTRRQNSQELYDAVTAYAAGAKVEACLCSEHETYWLRVAYVGGGAPDDYLVGDKLICADNGLAQRPPVHGDVYITVPMHCFSVVKPIVLPNPVVIPRDLVLARYMGIQPVKVPIEDDEDPTALVADPQFLTGAAGVIGTVTVTPVPENSTTGAITFASSNAGIASVNAETGVVTGVANGTCYITATAANGGAIAVCTVVIAGI